MVSGSSGRDDNLERGVHGHRLYQSGGQSSRISIEHRLPRGVAKEHNLFFDARLLTTSSSRIAGRSLDLTPRQTKGIETDVDFPLWSWVEQGMLAFFLAELAFRLRLRGCGFFTDVEDRGWNWLDFATVVSGVVDQWLLELWDNITQSENSDSEFGHMVTLARMLRLMRILRLVRVVKAIRPLRQLAIGVVRAMQSMFWVLVLTFVALYSLAILTTRMVGWGQLVDDPETLPAEAREMFSSMADSMFTLFAFMNGHEWHKVRPLLDLLPWMKPLFVGFTICGSWALLSVMTGVVSDHIQYVRVEQQREDDEARLASPFSFSITRLKSLLISVTLAWRSRTSQPETVLAA